MRIGILISSIGNFGQKGFYNAQEIGLAKALDSFCDEVKVYKLVSAEQKKFSEKIETTQNAAISFFPVKNFGINGIVDTTILDRSLDALIYFSDTQISVPKVYKWAKKNNVKFLPYIGVVESHSTNKIKKIVVDWLFERNLRVYKKSQCFVKTPAVEHNLKQLGVKNITVTPVGLDLGLLKCDFESYAVDELKVKYGYKAEDKVILFIGRLIEEKQPERMIEIFSQVLKNDSAYRLLLIGTGELKEKVQDAIQSFHLSDYVQMMERIPNSEIWELYRIADCFVNLNQQEIFGMAILEAMYYGCKVVAWKAPGPSFIIQDGISGILADNNEAIVEGVLNCEDMREAAHQRILEAFTWNSMASTVVSMIKAGM